MSGLSYIDPQVTLHRAVLAGPVFGDADGRAANANNRCPASASRDWLQHRTEVHTPRGQATWLAARLTSRKRRRNR